MEKPRHVDRCSRSVAKMLKTRRNRMSRNSYHFGSSGFPVGRGRGLVVAGGAHGLVVVGVLREYQPVGDVKVGFERVVDVIVQPAAHAVHRVPRAVALAHQIVP